MAKREEYRVGQVTITKAAASNFIADALFAGRGRRAAYVRINSRIDEAQSKGRLPQQPAMPADIFFGWAVDQKGWEKLIEVPEIPVSVSVSLTGLGAEAQVGSDFSGVPSPIEIDDLMQAHVEITRTLEATQRELASLRDHNAAIQGKRDALTLVLSESGKQGGRGKTK
jgi:hypothetical protein